MYNVKDLLSEQEIHIQSRRFICKWPVFRSEHKLFVNFEWAKFNFTYISTIWQITFLFANLVVLFMFTFNKDVVSNSEQRLVLGTKIHAQYKVEDSHKD